MGLTFPPKGDPFGGKGDGRDDVPSAEEAPRLYEVVDISEHPTDKDLARLADSLATLDTVPGTLLQELRLFRRLRTKERSVLHRRVDSLFDLDTVPHTPIRALRLKIQLREDKGGGPAYDDFMVPTAESPHPAHYFYKKWDTESFKPYDRSLAKKDTAIRLKLREPKKNCGYHHPILKDHPVLDKQLITSPYGMRDGDMHRGVDIDLQVWDTVYAAFPGKVRFSGRYRGYGRVVVIRHYNGLETVYAHLHRFRADVGDMVEAGDVVGLGGSSGHSTGSHLHFEVRFRGVPVNPAHLIDFEDKHLLGDTLVLKTRQRFGYAAYFKGTEFHTVESGEYLYKIAKHYGVSVNKLCELNGIRRNTPLYVGQKLRVGL